MLRVSLLTFGLLVGCGGREATSLATELGAVEVVAAPRKPNPFSTPCLQVASALRLPETKARCARSTLDTPITNTCAFPVRLSGESNGPFGVAKLPLELAPNATATATFAFLPETSGRHRSTLELVARADGFTRSTSLLLEATATEPRTASVEQRAPLPPPKELLIIVDDDGLPDADRQIEHVARWLSLGFTRVAVSDLAGNLQRPDDLAVLATESPTFIDRFTRAMHPPRLPGKRSCHETARTLMQQRQPPGFWAPEVLERTIVCIMNEADQSDLPASAMLGEWAVRFGDRPTPFLVVAPLGKADTCGVADARLEQLALGTGGARDTLCQSDWARVLEYLERSDGWWSFMLPLPGPPVRSTQRLVVTIDGITVPSSVWRFDTVKNAVVLPFPPEPGQRVRASWETCED